MSRFYFMGQEDIIAKAMIFEETSAKRLAGGRGNIVYSKEKINK
jgi:hypothetical protein